MARGAWQDASDAFESGLDSERRAEALEGLGWAVYWLDDLRRSMKLREQAFRAYRDADRQRDAGRVATGLGVDASDTDGEAVCMGWLGLAHRCLDELPPCAEQGWLYLWDGQLARMFRGDVERARSLGGEAAKLGRSLGIADLELLGSALEGLILVNEGQIDQGMRRLDTSTAAALIGDMTDLYSVTQTCCFLLHACEWVRDYDRMAQWTERVDAFAGDRNISSAFTPCRTQHAAMLIAQGRWEEAETQLQSVNEQLVMTRPWLAVESIEQLGELRRRQGRFDESEALFERAGARTVALLGRAHMALERQAADEALELGERALRSLSDARWGDRAIGQHVMVRGHLANGDADGAQQAIEALRETAAAMGTAHATALLHHAQGLMVAAEQPDDAKAHMSDALKAFEDARAPHEAALTRVALCEILIGSGRASAATAELDAAIAALAELGAERDAESARALRAGIGAAATVEDSSLSPREQQVLRLVADGLTDRAISAKLGISEHTVHRHISNILNKLDRPSRASAVAYALRKHLI